MSATTEPRQYRFGRIKPGGAPALRLAVPMGLAEAAAIGVALHLAFPQLRHTSMNAWLSITAICACFTPGTVSLTWVLLVDRSTLPGALPHPENSIESSWYDQAAKDGFHLIIAATGVGAVLASLWLPPMVSWTLVAVFAFAAVAFAASYLIRRGR